MLRVAPVSVLLCLSVLAVRAPSQAANQAPSRAQPAANPPERELLWPDGAPLALGKEAKDQPGVIVYHAPRGKDPHPAVMICPGGGYGGLAMGHEGHQIAAWLNSIGITGVILDYRHRGKGYGHPAPLLDAQRGLRLVRERASRWHVDPKRVGVLGFSAGGHLASSASVHHDGGDATAADPVDRHSCRPDFAVLCYPVIAFGQEFTHRGSQRNLLGPAPKQELVQEMSSERQVKADTPPTFLWHTTADRGVPPQNSVVYYLALVEHRVPCELHVFEQGRHGIGLGAGLAAGSWPSLCRRWLVTRRVLAE